MKTGKNSKPISNLEVIPETDINSENYVTEIIENKEKINNENYVRLAIRTKIKVIFLHMLIKKYLRMFYFLFRILLSQRLERLL